MQSGSASCVKIKSMRPANGLKFDWARGLFEWKVFEYLGRPYAAVDRWLVLFLLRLLCLGLSEGAFSGDD